MATKASTKAPDLAYEWLKNTVVTLPGDQELFLSEAQLAAESGMSRTPVREALLRLETEGFIRRVPYKGAYIPALTERDVQEVMQARRAVEEWSVTEMASSAEVTVERLFAILEKQRQGVDPVEFIAHDLEFHTTIIRAAGNSLMTDFYSSLRERQMRMGVRILIADKARRERVLDEHRAIVEAIAQSDPERAVSAVSAHLSSTLRAMRNQDS